MTEMHAKDDVFHAEDRERRLVEDAGDAGLLAIQKDWDSQRWTIHCLLLLQSWENDARAHVLQDREGERAWIGGEFWTGLSIIVTRAPAPAVFNSQYHCLETDVRMYTDPQPHPYSLMQSPMVVWRQQYPPPPSPPAVWRGGAERGSAG
jgi:hypothetical protein